MISSLIAALRGLGIEPSAEEVADAVWLALHMWGPPRDPASERGDSGAARGEDGPQPAPEPGPRQAPKDQAGGGTIQQETDDSLAGAERRGNLHALRPQQGARATAGSATPIRSPAAQALPGALDLNRALRPLMRRVPSRRLTIFDEEATAERIAEEGLWVPVLRPAQARRFDVALVVDDSASMRVWRQTVAEFQRLLERQGAFRDVRLWRLKSDAPVDEVPLYASKRMARRHPRELIDPAGRRLILLLTDCVSRAWEGQHLRQLLAEWGQRNHVAIVQMLPQRLWPQTALFEAEFFSVRAPAAGAPNTRLIKVSPGGARAAGEGVAFPILTLERAPSAMWARAVVGSGAALVPAVVLDAQGDADAGAIADERAEARSAKECVQHFHANSSATAFELALALAAAPLTLPVMRLVQQAVLPYSRQVHLAEVFLGGLLKRVSPDEDSHDPEATEYDFLPGVRDLLLDAALVPDSIQVLGVVSNYLEGRFGQALDFLALLEYPTDSGGMVLGERNQAFATVAAKVLRRLGGRYAQIAQVMEQSVSSASKPPLNVNASPAGHERAVAQHDLSVPYGLNLLHTLRAQTEPIGRMGWSKDGRWLATPSADTTICVWDTERGALHRIFRGHTSRVTSVAWVPNAPVPSLMSASDDGTIRFWRIDDDEPIGTSEHIHTNIGALAVSPDGRLCATGSTDNAIRLWHTRPMGLAQTLKGHKGWVTNLVWSPDGRLLASSSEQEGRLLLWEVGRKKPVHSLKTSSEVLSLDWSPRGEVIAAGCADGGVRLWDTATMKQVATLEGHTDGVNALSFSSDSRLLASRAFDCTTRLWRCDTQESVAILSEQKPRFYITGLSFHPHKPLLATLGEADRAVRTWEVDLNLLLAETPAKTPVYYTTAKIALLGDSGVGKTGLGWRLAHGEFKEHPSTHGQQFWMIDEMRMTRADGTECEAVLWDLAGQPDYRLVHSLFLEDIDVALVLFDPMNQAEPLRGVEYWLRSLRRRRGGLGHTILVGARSDRGVPTLSQQSLEEFCKQHGVSGGYINTSALTGDGVPELLERLRTQIHWDELAATVTTTTFKRIKDFVLAYKESSAHEVLLVSPEELRTRLEATDATWKFTDAEMMTAIGHLSNHGYVSVLRTPAGEEVTLLSPEILLNLAASFVLEARRNPLGLGALEEARVLEGGYEFPELAGLDTRERDVLLDAVTALFLEHNLCFRETLGAQTFLIFPALINQKRPLLGEIETVDDVSYRVSGAVENVYAALVVQFGYTRNFTRTNQWQNQAEYETARGDVCGFRQVDEREGEIELVLYYAKERPGARLLFQGLFEEFLRGRDVTVRKFPPVTCPKCKYRQQRAEVVKRIDEGRGFLFCGECGKKIVLPKEGEALVLSSVEQGRLKEAQERRRRRTAFESALVRVKAIVRDEKKAAPSCYVSYAWGDAEQERWVRGLANDLQNAGIEVILDQKDNSAIGANVARIIGRIEQSDFVIVVGTPLYRQKYENTVSTAGSVVAAEVNLINLRLTGPSGSAATVVPLLLEGDARSSLPPLMRGKVYGDFTNEGAYFADLFDLILTVYRIPFSHPAVTDLRDSLRALW